MPDLIERPSEAVHQEYETWKDLFQAQLPGTRHELVSQAAQLTESLLHQAPEVRFILPRLVMCKDMHGGTTVPAQIPAELCEQFVSNKNPHPPAFQLDQHLLKLERSPQRGISTAAGLIRYATAVQIANRPGSGDRTISPGLIDPIQEAQAVLDSMRRQYMFLESASTLAPYIAADENYLQRRNTLLRQMIDQGRSLAGCITERIIATIKQRNETGDLNRGLSLSLPYFDDQALDLKKYDFEVIPNGRILFEPAYVMWVARHQQREVEQDPGLNAAARQQLLVELRILEKAFEVPGAPIYRGRRVRRKILAHARLTSLRVALNTISVNWIRKTGS